MLTLSRRALLLGGAAMLVPGPAGAVPTPAMTEGPFYPSTRPDEDDSDLVHVSGAVRPAAGDRLQLGGRLLDADGRPLAGARVEIWQCDANGVYLDAGRGRHDPGFQGFGHATTGADGGFAFRTIVPVPYTGRTPHIHVKVLRDGRDLLTTQLFRAGHPQNERDFLFRRLSRAEQERASMHLRPVADGFATAIDVVVAG